MENFFSPVSAAQRYARGRPYFHPIVIGRIRAFLHLDSPLAIAVDAGCGTGLSCVALKEIAARIVGIDLSRAMLREAPADPRIRYVEASAERLPLAGGSVDLITAALAFHWLDRDRFLTEARRVLCPAGWLIVYNHGFYGRRKENPEYERWNRERYLARYPSPPRDRRSIGESEAARFGFCLAGKEEFKNDWPFTLDQLVAYLMTQSNVTAAIEGGRETAASVRTWLMNSLAPRFGGGAGTYQFGGEIWYLQRHQP